MTKKRFVKTEGVDVTECFPFVPDAVANKLECFVPAIINETRPGLVLSFRPDAWKYCR